MEGPRSLVERLTEEEHPSLSVMGARGMDRHGCRNAAPEQGLNKFLPGGGVGQAEWIQVYV